MGTTPPCFNKNAMALWREREAHREAVRAELVESGVDRLNASLQADYLADRASELRRSYNAIKQASGPRQVVAPVRKIPNYIWPDCEGCGAPRTTQQCKYCGRG